MSFPKDLFTRNLFKIDNFNEFKKYASKRLKFKLGNLVDNFSLDLFLMKNAISSESFLLFANSLKKKISSSIPNSKEIQSFIDSLIQYTKKNFQFQKSKLINLSQQVMDIYKIEDFREFVQFSSN
jgi:hypothetical protein